MQSRFMKGEKNPTILMLASSKRTEQSYLETFIENKKKNESKTTLVVDEPQWVIRTDKDSPNKFKVAIGNKFLNSEVLPLNITDDDLKIYRNKGFKIIDVPMGYYENFIDDIDVALTDIAGISTSNSSRYISGPRLANIKKDYIKNPFTKEVIEVGNDPNDTAQYSDFFDINLIDRSLLSRPLFVHLDMSVSGDKTGIAGIWIMGKKPPKEGQNESRDLLFRTAFSVSVKAPKGHQISFEKNRQFIYWLKEQGFAIKCVSSDTFQSVDTGQALKSKGFNYEVISVDRVDSDRICLTGDMEVLTTEGYVRIDKLDPTYKVISYNINENKLEEDKITDWLYTSDVEEYYEIETETGIIKCTGNHLILTSNRGYVRADELTSEDLILNVKNRE